MSKAKKQRNRVLICDDEKTQYVKLRRYLESEDFECEECVNTYEGVVEKLSNAVSSRRWYHMVMMDIDLRRSGEKLNGIQMYQALAAEFPDENYVVYSRHDADKFRSEINRLRFREVSLVLLDEVLTQNRLRLHLTRLIDSVDHRKVFLVCGRNTVKNAGLIKFLNEGLRLDVIPWETARRRAKSDYVFEIVLQGIQMSHATVVLFTDDEEVKLRKKFLKADDDDASGKSGRWQARPNVYIEAGYARGIRQKRTIFVEWPDRVRGFKAPSDFSGIHSARFTGDRQSREQLAERLEAARCLVDRSPAWLTMKL
jgi:predicted nucleotide-binding protein/CheY-like chemotaxis protein